MSSSTPPDPPVGSVAAWTEGALRASGRTSDGPRYLPAGELGRGGMGIVNAVWDGWLDREIAMKRPRPGLPHRDRQHILREARLTARLSHPGIVPIHELGEDAQGVYYTMPVLAGRTLERVVGDDELSLRQRLRVLVSSARTVSFAHDRGIVHRDLTPSNVLLGDHGDVRVLDWGVAWDGEAPDRSVVGTPGWRSPEQAAGEAIGPPADVYALGRLLAFMRREDDRRDPSLDAIVQRATAPDPTDRYPDAAAFADDVDRWLDGRRVQAHRYSVADRLRRFTRRRRWPLTVAGGVLLTGMLAALATVPVLTAERDRAVAAAAQAESHLAAALAAQAAARLIDGIDPHTDALAAEALTHGDQPDARGVLMATRSRPGPTALPIDPLPCARPVIAADGDRLCGHADGDLNATLSRHAPDGTARWTAHARPGPEGPAWAAGYRQARAFDGGVLLIRRPNTLEVWQNGVRTTAVYRRRLELTDGPSPGVHDGHRVARVAFDNATLRWSEPICDRIHRAWLETNRVVVACAAAEVHHGALDALNRLPLDAPASAVAVGTDLLIADFEGRLHARGDRGWWHGDSGVGVVSDLQPVGRTVAIRGEQGRVRWWRPAEGAFVGRLDGRWSDLAVARGRLWTLSDDAASASSPPAEGPAARIDRTDLGGVGFLAARDDPPTLLAGHGTGAVETWDLDTGRSRVIAPGCGNTARAGLVLPDGLLFSQLGCATRRVLHDGPVEDLGSPVRDLAAHGDRVLAAGYSDVVRWLHPDGRRRRTIRLPSRPVSVAVTATGAWAVDITGQVHTIGDSDATPLLRLDHAGLVAADEHGLYTVDHDVLRAHAPDGTVHWQVRRPARVTAIAIVDEHLALGDAVGQLTLLDRHTGLVHAVATAHRRRVSGIARVGMALYTASWDGTLQRWSLEVLDNTDSLRDLDPP